MLHWTRPDRGISMMDVKIFDNDTEAGKYAFDLIKQGMDNGAKVLGLATGSTPVTMYKAMVNSDVDFSNMTSINLDEYVGLAPDNDQSYNVTSCRVTSSTKAIQGNLCSKRLG